MKNIELYRTIEALVEAKKQQYTPTFPSFAHEYCKKQIQKKKLIPFNPQSKMSRIMKNFHQLDTYVNVEQLFEYIDMKNTEKQNEEKLITSTNIKWKSKQQIVFNDLQSLQKIRRKLGPYNQRIFNKQNQDMKDLIDYLEKDSQVASLKRRNSPSNDDLNFFDRHTKPTEEKQNFQNNNEKWKYYEGCNYIIDEHEPCDKKNNKIQMQRLDYKQNLRLRREKMDLIHQVTTYLQIILENHHKKKWGYKNPKITESTTMHQHHQAQQELKTESKLIQSQQEGLRKQRKKTTKILRHATRHTDHRSLCQKSALITTKTSPDSSFVSPMKKTTFLNCPSSTSTSLTGFNSTQILGKSGLKQTFTFRNRNIKQNLLKKVNAFLQFVESEQKQFKKQKNVSIDQLNNLENKQKIYNEIGGDNFIIDDQELKAVQNIVHMQK